MRLKKIFSGLLSLAVLAGAAYMPAYAAADTGEGVFLIDHDFTDKAEADLYTIDVGIDNKSTSNGNITVDFTSGWNEDNGIKIDITELLGTVPGQMLYASADVYTTATNGASRIFIETVSATGESTQIMIAESMEYDTDSNISLSGSCDAVTLNAGDTAYLCITQWSGYARFDNIKLWYNSGKTTLFEHTFNSEKAAQAAMYATYEEGYGTVEGGSGTVLKYDKGSASGTTAGIKIDLTENFGVDGTMSGNSFGASAYVKPGYSWNDGNSVEMFFEIVNGDNTEKVSICTADTETFAETAELFDSETSYSLGENWLAKPLSGEAVLDIADGDCVYLCITTDNNPVWYDDITVYTQPGAEEPDPDEPEPEQPKATLAEAAWAVTGADAGYTVDGTNNNELKTDDETVYGYKAEFDGLDNTTYTTVKATFKRTGSNDIIEQTKTITKVTSNGGAVFYIISNAELDMTNSSIVLE